MFIHTHIHYVGITIRQLGLRTSHTTYAVRRDVHFKIDAVRQIF